MRALMALCFCLLFAGFAAAQVAVVSGNATTAAPGSYAVPAEPLVTTPEMQFQPPPLQVGASNATSGLVAGARNSTSGLSMPAEAAYNAPAPEFAGSALDVGVATSQDDIGVAQLAPKSVDHKTVRTFTNQDIDRLKQ